MNNYHPVLNIAFVTKIMEKIAVRQVQTSTGSTSSRKLLHQLIYQPGRLRPSHPLQSAYKRCHGIKTALVKVKADIDSIIIMDEGDAVILVLLNLSAAFDTIDHQLLLQHRRVELSIRDAALDWIQSYLCERKQCVVVGDDVSEPRPLTIRVPQGSVIGPLLLTLYQASDWP
jgi:hypothetical protein